MNHFLIDGFGLAYRSLYAFSNLTTVKGIYSGCVYGFLVSLRSLKKKYSSFHFTVAWDMGSDHRRKLYADYKANRNEFSIDEHIDDLKKILGCINITQVELKGEEADDVMASFVEKNKEQGLIYVYSSDKDLLQLVQNGKVIVIKPKSGVNPEKYFDEGAVLALYGVEPRDLASFQAFRGDSVDNIPGVPRLPSKVISSLISKYKTPQAVYGSLESEKLTDFQRNTIKTSEQQVYLNYELTRLRTHLDYDIREGSDNGEVLEFYLKKYEIKSVSVDSLMSVFEKESSFSQRFAPAIQNYSLF